MRLALIPPAAALLLVPLAPAALAAAPSSPAASDTRVTAVSRDASGHLAFRHGHAAGAAAAAKLAARWRGEAGVVAASVEHKVRIAADPLEPQQWGLSALHSADVGVATGQVVAVVDTGVDSSHPDLAGVVLPGARCIDPDPCGGTGTTDPNGHGTHVAGIVAAVGGNGIGGAGLAQGAQILPVQVMAADGTGWDGDAARGVVWATDHGATVVNLSLGGTDPSDVMYAATNYALSKGVTVVVAAGNDGGNGDPVEYPAAFPGVIAVGAVDSSGVRPFWSSTGSHLAVVAPGVDILSTVPTAVSSSGYQYESGTSMATPFVSAAAALVRHAQPTLLGAAVRQRLMANADDLGPAGFDPAYGAGLVDVVRAEADTSPITIAAAPVMTARISASRTSTPYGGLVNVSGRVLADGNGTAGVPVRLDRLVSGSWVTTRTATSGVGGLASWSLHPTATTYYRFAGLGWTSSLLRIVVTPVISITARTTGISGRVLPAGATYVRIDVHRSTGWVALTTVRSATDGTYRLSRTFATGTYVRAVAYSVASPTARVS